MDSRYHNKGDNIHKIEAQQIRWSDKRTLTNIININIQHYLEDRKNQGCLILHLKLYYRDVSLIMPKYFLVNNPKIK